MALLERLAAFLAVFDLKYASCPEWSGIGKCVGLVPVVVEDACLGSTSARDSGAVVLETAIRSFETEAGNGRFAECNPVKDYRRTNEH
jgi:hypothetical protein